MGGWGWGMGGRGGHTDRCSHSAWPLSTLLFKIKSLIFVVIFEPYLLQEFINLRKMKGKIKARKKALKIRLTKEQINSL